MTGARGVRMGRASPFLGSMTKVFRIIVAADILAYEYYLVLRKQIIIQRLYK